MSMPCAMPESYDDLGPTVDYDRMAAPALLIFGDDPARRRCLAERATDAGMRIVGEGAISDARTRLEMQAVGHVLLDLVADGGEALDALLDHLEDAGSPETIVVAGCELIDLVARWPRLSAAMLVGAGGNEVVAALAAMASPPPAAVHDGGLEANGRHLQSLRDELGRISRSLAALSGSIDAAPPTIVRNGADLRARAARAEIRQRRLRDQFFESTLFADPAWDMLLDLAASANERRRVAVSSLCIAAAVPPTTALRWISQMTEQGLLVREPDPDDRRRVFVTLSEAARTAMDGYLDAIAATSQ